MESRSGNQPYTDAENRHILDTLYRLAAERKMSMRQLALAIGISPQYLSGLKRSKTGFGRASMLKLAEYLGKSEAEILAGTPGRAAARVVLPWRSCKGWDATVSAAAEIYKAKIPPSIWHALGATVSPFRPPTDPAELGQVALKLMAESTDDELADIRRNYDLHEIARARGTAAESSEDPEPAPPSRRAPRGSGAMTRVVHALPLPAEKSA